MAERDPPYPAYRKAADQGYVRQRPGRVPQDYAEAVKWFRKAAGQSNPMAQYNLGVMYNMGRGVTQDYAEAVKWFRKAAGQGYALAQFSLALMYDKGRGVTQDYAEGGALVPQGRRLGRPQGPEQPR